MKAVPKGFAKTGKAKPAQFAPGVSGKTEKGFRQKSQKQVTAAMQGRLPQGGEVTAKPKNNGRRQFQNAPGKKVF
jgi:hypothetical protein